MTTNVPKGAGRATATAKRNKHAQRTPLPPQKGSPGFQAIEAASCAGGEEAHYAHLEANSECPWDHASDRVVEEARAVTPDPAPEKPMGEKTVGELRKQASGLGVENYKILRKGDLLNAILLAERAKSKTAERLAGRDLAAEVFATAEKSVPAKAPSPARKRGEAPAPIARIVPGPDDRPAVHPGRAAKKAAPATVEQACSGEVNVSEAQAKSIAKAEAFLKAAADLGWAEKTRSAPDQNPYGVIVGRGDERITISWRDGVFVGEECYHSHPARTPRKVINASAAKKIMAIPAATADEEARKVTAHKSARPGRVRGAEATTERRKALPFDVETADDEEVLRAVSGRRISWTNEISGAIEEAHVKGSVDEISIQHGKSGRSIRFTSTTGFRSVRVKSLVSIR
jgi:hypothetical protein